MTKANLSACACRRRLLWVKLALLGLAGWICTFIGAHAALSAKHGRDLHAWLDKAQKLIFALILLRAVKRVQPRRSKYFGKSCIKERDMARAIYGLALRRAA